MHLRVFCAALLCLGLAMPTASFGSDAAFEPNEGIHQAHGPLQASTDYDAEISSGTDRDWYVFYVSAAGLVDLEITNLADGAGCCVGPEVYLTDADGKSLGSKSPPEGDVAHIEYTTPGPGAYYVSVRERAPLLDTYRLRLSGPVTDGPALGAATPTPNNNPDRANAFGPLLGGHIYEGRQDGSNEEDWFYFYTAGPGTFDVSFTNIFDGFGLERPDVDLYDKDGNRLVSGGPGEDEIDHLTYPAAGPSTFVLRVYENRVGDRYQFRIDPAGLLTTAPPPGDSVSDPASQGGTSASQGGTPPRQGSTIARATASCKKARTGRRKIVGAFRKAKRRRAKAARRLRKAHNAQTRRNWRKSKRRWTKATKKRRRMLRNANRRMRKLCA